MRHRDDFTFSRRTLLAFATGAGVSVFCPVSAWAKAEFWNQKDPSQWTAEEINQILTKSPWAKQVDTQAQGEGGQPRRRSRMGMGIPGIGYPGGGYPGGGYPGGGYPGGGYPGGGYPGGGGYPRGGRYPGGGGEGGGLRYNVTVRWESATPVRLALKDPPPEATTGNYVISVSGLPEHLPTRRRESDDDDTQDDPKAEEKRQENMLERMKDSTTLELKGGGVLHPDKVVRQESSSGSVLFIFSKGTQPISEDAKEATFITRMGPLEVKAKFNLKDMKFRGNLAV